MADKSGACSLAWVPNLFLEIKTELPGTKGNKFDTLILGNLTRIRLQKPSFNPDND